MCVCVCVCVTACVCLEKERGKACLPGFMDRGQRCACIDEGGKIMCAQEEGVCVCVCVCVCV